MSDLTLPPQPPKTYEKRKEHTINDCVSVVLTKYGAEIHNEHHAELMEKYPELFKRVIPGDTIRMPLWKIMNIFGSWLSNGSNAPFLDNKIKFDSR